MKFNKTNFKKFQIELNDEMKLMPMIVNSYFDNLNQLAVIAIQTYTAKRMVEHYILSELEHKPLHKIEITKNILKWDSGDYGYVSEGLYTAVKYARYFDGLTFIDEFSTPKGFEYVLWDQLLRHVWFNKNFDYQAELKKFMN